jgi:hypothetical protein
MATVNTTITSAWTKLADAADDPVLITSGTSAVVEVATVATNVAPSVTGHRLEELASGQAVTRAVIGDGYIFARIVDPRFLTAEMVVSK